MIKGLKEYFAFAMPAGKDSLKNKFTELALRFRLDLDAPIEQSRRNSELFRGLCGMRSVQRQPEGEMSKCEVIFERVLSFRSAKD